MPSVLESGEFLLSRDEVDRYRAAADRLRNSCELIIDLEQPIKAEVWMLLAVADFALKGDLEPLTRVIGVLEAEVQARGRAS